MGSPAEPSREPEYTGRVIITWPNTNQPTLPAWGVTIADADTGQMLTNVIGLRMILGAERDWGVIDVELEQLTDADGKPLRTGQSPVPVGTPPSGIVESFTPDQWAEREKALADNPQKLLSATFRYVVAEMRIAEPPPTPFESEARTIAEAQTARDGS